MRKTLTVAALVAGVAAAMLPIAPASANCDPVILLATGKCTNLCVILTPDRPCPR